jgi:hypothetical protein
MWKSFYWMQRNTRDIKLFLLESMDRRQYWVFDCAVLCEKMLWCSLISSLWQSYAICFLGLLVKLNPRYKKERISHTIRYHSKWETSITIDAVYVCTTYIRLFYIHSDIIFEVNHLSCSYSHVTPHIALSPKPQWHVHFVLDLCTTDRMQP